MVTSSEKTTALMQAIGLVQIEAGPVYKDGENPHFHSTYTTLDSVLATLKPLWEKHGIVVTQAVTHLGNTDPLIPILTTVVHHPESGQWLSSPAQLVTDKPGPQALGSAITYMRRYSLKAIFAMEDTDDDGEAAMDRSVTPEKVANAVGGKIVDASKGITPDYVIQKMREAPAGPNFDTTLKRYRNYMNTSEAFTAAYKKLARDIIEQKKAEADKK
jgi:hypothetical protein